MQLAMARMQTFQACGLRNCGMVPTRGAIPPLRTRATPHLPRSAVVSGQPVAKDAEEALLLKSIDDKLSWRPLQLDPAGYFIIRLDRESREIVADHYSNAINEKGLAVDDETGEVIGCRPGGAVRLPRRTFRGRTAKEISVRILEEPLLLMQADQQPKQSEQCTGDAAQPQQGGSLPWMSRLEHANYLGREFVRAEHALLTGVEYVQD
ncbi:hypothetical protein PLESTM_001187600 [Pleodorina starrii]|nr:hypothetical protein PLESTM_001187600 [Pleodorina starrii]